MLQKTHARILFSTANGIVTLQSHVRGPHDCDRSIEKIGSAAILRCCLFALLRHHENPARWVSIDS